MIKIKDTSSIDFAYVFAQGFGECFIALASSIIILYIHLKKKYKEGDDFKFPIALFFVILFFAVLGVISEYGKHKRESRLDGLEKESTALRNNEKYNESNVAYYENGNEEISDSVKDARIFISSFVSLVKQGLPMTKDGMSWCDIEIDKNTVKYYYEIDGRIVDFKTIEKDIEKNPMGFYKIVNANSPDFVKNMIIAEYDAYIDIYDIKTRKLISAKLSAHEIQEAYK